MKLNFTSSQIPDEKYFDKEALIERGRQLHSQAVFEMCSKFFNRNEHSRNIKRLSPKTENS